MAKKRKNRNNNASKLRRQALRSEIKSNHHHRRMIYAHCFHIECSCRFTFDGRCTMCAYRGDELWSYCKFVMNVEIRF
ncbi:hypothetical protein RIR_jg13076.t1 [Rhizophagus irregularis DAOM 181602=DAOM 197198]|nr:hypothetical protein RIR_jg13076.t1 [Rhizophagus irregularis DAOM 181602=DAOM 197198]